MTDERRKRTAEIIAESVWSLAEPVIIRSGMELIDAVYTRGPSGMVLRLTIDKPGGVTVDDCADISHLVSDILDVKDPIAGPYHLEVSSPGINRPLKRRGDYERFEGERIFIETKELRDGRRRFKGKLKGILGDNVVVAVEGNTVEIPMEQVAKARLDII